ncbi:hypothetical protein O3P69_007208 [Scylla paramamosain]|uniref:Mutator-like transposase domain-containing protein n=1 Tax=Scylla paramamosain TaxID=85552 RepID=A0AAW0V277_SCYPA
MAPDVALLDLRKAYLQVRVHRPLLPYQTVFFRGQRYCLTRLGFGISIAPMVMKAVVSEVLKQDNVIKEAASPYVNNIFLNEDFVTSGVVVNHLRQFGLECNPTQRVEKGARVLGLRVGGSRILQWRRDNDIKEAPVPLTRRSLFSLVGTEEPFDEWHAGHASECHLNHLGSSGAMASAAAVLMWERSLSYNLRYTTFISDGDSSTYIAVKNLNDGNGAHTGKNTKSPKRNA